MLVLLLAACWRGSDPESPQRPVGGQDEPTEYRWYRDDDGDGYGHDGVVEVTTTPTSWPGLVLQDGDCDDGDEDAFPGNVETCDGVDQDCDGLVDDAPDDGVDGWYDGDHDGYGTGEPGRFCRDRVAAVGGDCDDQAADAHPGAVEFQDDRDTDCDGADSGAIHVAAWFETAPHLGVAMAIADVTGDGAADLALLGHTDTTPYVSVFGGPIAEDSLATVSTVTFASWYSLRASDVDGDGVPNLVTGCTVVPSPIPTPEAQGSCPWLTSDEPIGAEVDGDGVQDVVVSELEDGVDVYRGPYADGDLPVLTLVGSRVLDGRDLDGDGVDELLLGDQSNVYLYMGPVAASPDATWSNVDEWPRAYTGDVDGDGYADAIAPSPYADSPVWRGGATGVSARGAVSFGLRPLGVGLGADLDGDGRPDLAVANRYGLYVLPDPGDGRIQLSQERLALPSELTSLAVGDVDGDGQEDVVVADEGDVRSYLFVLGGW